MRRGVRQIVIEPATRPAPAATGTARRSAHVGRRRGRRPRAPVDGAGPAARLGGRRPRSSSPTSSPKAWRRRTWTCRRRNWPSGRSSWLLASAGILFWRRTRPLAVLGGVLALYAIAAGTIEPGLFTQLSGAATVLALYAVASWSARRRWAVLLPVVLLALVVSGSLGDGNGVAESLAVAMAVVALPWVLGYAARTRRLYLARGRATARRCRTGAGRASPPGCARRARPHRPRAARRRRPPRQPHRGPGRRGADGTRPTTPASDPRRPRGDRGLESRRDRRDAPPARRAPR